MQALFLSVVNGDLEGVKKLSQKVNLKGELFISLACSKGHNEIVKFFLSFLPPLSFEEKYLILGECLERACYNGHFDTIRLLVENKADVNFNFGNPLSKALVQGDIEIIKFLIENRAQIKLINESTLNYILFYHKLEKVKQIVSQGIIFNKNILEAFCLVHLSRKNFPFVEFLLSLGGTLEVQSNLFTAWKIWRRWRIIHWKKYFRKIITPLYYSPGFPGDKKEKKDFLTIINSEI